MDGGGTQMVVGSATVAGDRMSVSDRLMLTRISVNGFRDWVETLVRMEVPESICDVVTLDAKVELDSGCIPLNESAEPGHDTLVSIIEKSKWLGTTYEVHAALKIGGAVDSAFVFSMDNDNVRVQLRHDDIVVKECVAPAKMTVEINAFLRDVCWESFIARIAECAGVPVPAAQEANVDAAPVSPPGASTETVPAPSAVIVGETWTGDNWQERIASARRHEADAVALVSSMFATVPDCRIISQGLLIANGGACSSTKLEADGEVDDGQVALELGDAEPGGWLHIQVRARMSESVAILFTIRRFRSYGNEATTVAYSTRIEGAEFVVTERDFKDSDKLKRYVAEALPRLLEAAADDSDDMDSPDDPLTRSFDRLADVISEYVAGADGEDGEDEDDDDEPILLLHQDSQAAQMDLKNVGMPDDWRNMPWSERLKFIRQYEMDVLNDVVNIISDIRCDYRLECGTLVLYGALKDFRFDRNGDDAEWARQLGTPDEHCLIDSVITAVRIVLSDEAFLLVDYAVSRASKCVRVDTKVFGGNFLVRHRTFSDRSDLVNYITNDVMSVLMKEVETPLLPVLTAPSPPAALPAPPPSAEAAPVPPGTKLIASSLGSSCGNAGREIRKTYGKLLKPLPLLGSNDHAAVSAALDEQYPWCGDVTREIAGMLALTKMLGVPGFRIQPLLLVGAPGTGKTSYAAKMCRAAGVPSDMFPGGTDAAAMAGTTRVWSDSQPCHPVVAALRHGCANPCIIVDEIDKAPTDDKHGTLVSVLLSFLEQSSASTYYDRHLLATVDLSRVNWVLTANSLATIPTMLLSRCRVIGFPEPTVEYLDRLLVSARNTVAARFDVAADVLPPLRPEDELQLREAFARSRSMRDLVLGIERAMGCAAMGAEFRMAA